MLSNKIQQHGYRNEEVKRLACFMSGILGYREAQGASNSVRGIHAGLNSLTLFFFDTQTRVYDLVA